MNARVILILVAFVALLCWMSAAAQAGLIAHWTLDETSGQVAYDVTGKGHDAQLGSTTGVDTNDPTQGIPGKIGTAYNFDGTNDYMLVQNQADLSGMSNLTLVAWFVLETSTPTTDRLIFRKWDGGNTYIMGVQNYAKDIRVTISEGTGGSFSTKGLGAALSYLYSEGFLTLNTWQHMAFTYEGSTRVITFYLNGQYINEYDCGTGSGSIRSTTNTLNIGGLVASNKDWWKNGLDDLGILDEALTVGKVRSLYTVPTDTDLGYNLSSMYKLFEVYETGTPVTIGSLTWHKVTGLTGGEGKAWFAGGYYYVQLDATGGGVSTIPEPSAIGLLVGGVVGMLYYAWKKRESKFGKTE